MITYTSDVLATVDELAGTDRKICKVARVSTLGEKADEDVATMKRNDGLIRYLMQNKHGSPFEHGMLTFLVEAPIFVFWDHVRHRIGVSYNVESSRYRELQPTFYVPRRARVQEGKPGQYVYMAGTQEQTDVLRTSTELANTVAWGEYQARLKAGICREQAMQVLPMNTVIHAYVTFNPRSLMKFLELRLGPAREEMQALARAYAGVFAERWPLTFAAFQDFGRVAP